MEFIFLWIWLRDVHIQPKVEDSVNWKWTPNEKYTAKLAYQIQFVGSFEQFRNNLIGKAEAENKCKLFAWTLILTTNNLAKRGWPHQTSLCIFSWSTGNGSSLMFKLPFAAEVWRQVLVWQGFSQPPHLHVASHTSINWWEVASHGLCIYV
jgi:hypothetical protein